MAFFVNAAGEKMDEPVVIWKSKMPRFFKRLSGKSRPADTHYFSKPNLWMASDVIQAVLTRFNRKLLFEQRKVALILDNSTYHPESIIDSFLQIKTIFLHQNTTSRLQPLDAGIIKNFKLKVERDLLSMYLLELMNTL